MPIPRGVNERHSQVFAGPRHYGPSRRGRGFEGVAWAPDDERAQPIRRWCAGP
jgi:hypothetical protein